MTDRVTYHVVSMSLFCVGDFILVMVFCPTFYSRHGFLCTYDSHTLSWNTGRTHRVRYRQGVVLHQRHPPSRLYGEGQWRTETTNERSRLSCVDTILPEHTCQHWSVKVKGRPSWVSDVACSWSQLHSVCRMSPNIVGRPFVTHSKVTLICTSHRSRQSTSDVRRTKMTRSDTTKCPPTTKVPIGWWS